MTHSQFVEKVSEMRNAQKQYFRTRSSEILRRAKQLEREVDAEIARFCDPQDDLFAGREE